MMAHDNFILHKSPQGLELRRRDEPQCGGVYVDFVHGISAHRRKYGGGRRQAVVRAIGVKKGNIPTVVDATAGLGRDAFVLASVGCRVHMIERSEVVGVLLQDGLTRAKGDPDIGFWVTERMSLSIEDSRAGLLALPFEPDVIYLDPMFPDKKKPALVKKEMRMFKELIGLDSDAGDLLKVALRVARQRVVVKRPAWADALIGPAPDASVKTPKNRFDLYFVI